jgi:hypothetical protein
MRVKLCSAIIFLTSALLQQSVSAEIMLSQGIWQQPYTPTKLQWLFTNFLNEKFFCFSTPDTNRPIAFYTWGKPGQNDNELMLFVSAENNFQLDSCTIGAFELLRNASFEMQIKPPKVQLTHHLIARRGNTIPGSRIYQCSVPEQLRDHRTDIKYDTAYDLGGFQNLCK